MIEDFERLVKRVTDNDTLTNLSKGIAPSTKETIQQLESTKRNIKEKLQNESDTLTPKAQKTLRDFNLALDTVELNLIQKNRDNILQKFIYHATKGITKLQDALKSMPDDQRAEMVKMKKDMVELNHTLEAMKKKVLDLLRNFASSSLLREVFYEIYQTLFQITSPKLPQDEPPSVDMLKLTDEDIKLLKSQYNAIMERVQENSAVRDGLLDVIDFTDDVVSQLYTTTSYYLHNPQLTEPSRYNPSLAGVDDELRSAANYLIQFLENAAHGTSLTPTIDSFNHLNELTMKDNKLANELSAITKESQEFLRNSLTKKDFSESEEYGEKFNSVIRKLHDVLVGEYSKEISDLRDKLSYFLDNLANDPGMKQLSTEMGKIMQDMKIDPATAEPEDILKDVYCFLTDVFPVILSGLDVLPIPRVESSDENFDLILDNLRVVLDYVVPSKIHIRSDTDFSRLKQKGVTFQERIHLTMKDVHFSAYNIAFYYNKKTGIKTKDIGLLNLQDVGLNVNIILDFESFVAEANVTIEEPDVIDVSKKPHASSTKTLVSKSRIKIEKVDVDVHTLRMKFHDTSQDSFYTFFYPIIRMKMKSTMGSTFSDLVRDSLKKSMDPNYLKHALKYGGTEIVHGRDVEV